MRNDGRAKEATVVLSTAVPSYTHAGIYNMYMYNVMYTHVHVHLHSREYAYYTTCPAPNRFQACHSSCGLVVPIYKCMNLCEYRHCVMSHVIS